MSTQALHWQLEDEVGAQALIEILANNLRLHAHPPLTHTVTLYDTHPWQLWFDKKALIHEANRLSLYTLSDKSLGVEQAWTELGGALPRFWWELPEAVGTPLKPLIKLRALLPRLRYHHSEIVHDIKNEDDKTLARLIINEYRRDTHRGRVFLRTLGAHALRGYDKAHDALVRELDKQGLERLTTSPVHACLDALDARPRPYRPKPLIPADATLDMGRALCTSLGQALAFARSCEAGIVEDIDIEFVHDYRVCLRAMRALLTQIKGVFSPQDESRLKSELAELGRRTNRLRDLDVYLLEEQTYRHSVPARLGDALQGMFDDFRRERRTELGKVRRHLQSKTYEKRMRGLEQLLEALPTHSGGELSRRPALEVAEHSLDRQYRKLMRKGRTIHRDTPDEAIHGLRLQGKKLRYLLEFFAPLLQTGPLGKLLQSMRELQDTLGAFNDLSVQQNALFAYYTEQRTPEPELGLALGALMGTMNRRQRKLRKRVMGLFAHFDSAETRTNVKQLFHPGAGTS